MVNSDLSIRNVTWYFTNLETKYKIAVNVLEAMKGFTITLTYYSNYAILIYNQNTSI
jgi:hypothetical protein